MLRVQVCKPTLPGVAKDVDAIRDQEAIAR
jgi:hypothetical protein